MKNFKFALGSLLLVTMFTIASSFSSSPNTSNSSGPAPAPKVDVCDFYKFITTFRIGVTSSTVLAISTNYVKNPSGFTESNCNDGQYFCGVKVCRPSTCRELTLTEIANAVKAKYDASGLQHAPATGSSWTVNIDGCTYTFISYLRGTDPEND